MKANSSCGVHLSDPRKKSAAAVGKHFLRGAAESSSFSGGDEPVESAEGEVHGERPLVR